MNPNDELAFPAPTYEKDANGTPTKPIGLLIL